jgi:hypothetical protein
MYIERVGRGAFFGSSPCEGLIDRHTWLILWKLWTVIAVTDSSWFIQINLGGADGVVVHSLGFSAEWSNLAQDLVNQWNYFQHINWWRRTLQMLILLSCICRVLGESRMSAMWVLLLLKINFQKLGIFRTAMAKPRPTKLLSAAFLKSSKYRNFGGKFTDSLEQVHVPQHYYFSKIWPSSRFGLAMAVLEIWNTRLSTLTFRW